MNTLLPSVTMVMVMSADGRTKSPLAWSSHEDHLHFQQLKQHYPALIMGRKTYETVRTYMEFTPPPVRFVMTRHPKRYADQERHGVLKFTDVPPVSLLTNLAKSGISSVLLAGGSSLNSVFLRHKLITNCIITVEPVILGSGIGLFARKTSGVNLILTDKRVVNKRGTTVLYYTVEYEGQRI